MLLARFYYFVIGWRERLHIPQQVVNLSRPRYNKSCFWTNTDVFSSETYRIFVECDDHLYVKSSRKIVINDPFNVIKTQLFIVSSCQLLILMY